MAGNRLTRKGERRTLWTLHKNEGKTAKKKRAERAEKHEALLEKQATDKAARIKAKADAAALETYAKELEDATRPLSL